MFFIKVVSVVTSVAFLWTNCIWAVGVSTDKLAAQSQLADVLSRARVVYIGTALHSALITEGVVELRTLYENQEKIKAKLRESIGDVVDGLKTLIFRDEEGGIAYYTFSKDGYFYRFTTKETVDDPFNRLIIDRFAVTRSQRIDVPVNGDTYYQEIIETSPEIADLISTCLNELYPEGDNERKSSGGSSGVQDEDLVLAKKNFKDAINRIKRSRRFTDEQETELETILKYIFSEAMPYFEKGAKESPVYHNTQVLDNMVRIGLGENLSYDEFKLAVILALLHDIGNACCTRKKVKNGEIKAKIKENKLDEAIELAQQAIKFRLEHMEKGPDIVRLLTKPLVDKGKLSLDDVEVVCGAVKVHDNPSIEGTVNEMKELGVAMSHNPGDFLFTFDDSLLNKLIQYLCEADRLFMVIYQGVVNDLKDKKEEISKPNIRNKLKSNRNRHREEYGLYKKANRDDGRFLGESLYRTKTGYAIFEDSVNEVEIELMVNRLVSDGIVSLDEMAEAEKDVKTFILEKVGELIKNWQYILAARISQEFSGYFIYLKAEENFNELLVGKSKTARELATSIIDDDKLVEEIKERSFESLEVFINKEVESGRMKKNDARAKLKTAKKYIDEWLDKNNNIPAHIRAGIIRGMLEGRDSDLLFAFGEGWRKFGTGGIRNPAVASEYMPILDLELQEFADDPHAAILTGPNMINTVTILQQESVIAKLFEYLNDPKLNLDERFKANIKNRKITIAYDSRLNGEYFAKMLACAFLRDGINVDLFDNAAGMPALVYAADRRGSAFGFLISASHSEANYNGFKAVLGHLASQLDASGKDMVMRERAKVTYRDMYFDLAEMTIAGFEGIMGVKKDNLRWLGSSQKKPAVNYCDAEVVDFYTGYYKHVASRSPLVNLDTATKKKVKKVKREMRVFYTAFYGVGAVPAGDFPGFLKQQGYGNVSIVKKQTKKMDGRFEGHYMPDPGVVSGWVVNLLDFLIQEAGADLKKISRAIKKLNSQEVGTATDPDIDRAGMMLSLPRGIEGNIKKALIKAVDIYLSNRVAQNEKKKVIAKIENELNDKYLLTANDAWAFMAYYQLKLLKDKGKLEKGRIYFIEESHVTTPALERIAKLFRDKQYKIYVIQTYVGFTELAKKSRDLFTIAEISNNFVEAYRKGLGGKRKKAIKKLIIDLERAYKELKSNVPSGSNEVPEVREVIEKLKKVRNKTDLQDALRLLKILSNMEVLYGVEESNGYGEFGRFDPDKGEVVDTHICEKDGSLAAFKFLEIIAYGKLQGQTGYEMFGEMIREIGHINTDNRFLPHPGLKGNDERKAEVEALEKIFAYVLQRKLDNGEEVHLFNGRYKLERVKIYRDGKYDDIYIGFPEEGVRLYLKTRKGSDAIVTLRPAGTGDTIRSYAWILGKKPASSVSLEDYRRKINAELEELARDFFGDENLQGKGVPPSGYVDRPKDTFYGLLAALKEGGRKRYEEVFAKAMGLDILPLSKEERDLIEAAGQLAFADRKGEKAGEEIVVKNNGAVEAYLDSDAAKKCPNKNKVEVTISGKKMSIPNAAFNAWRVSFDHYSDSIEMILNRLGEEDMLGQMERLYGKTYEEAQGIGAEKMSRAGFENKKGEMVNMIGWTLTNLQWLLHNPDKVDDVLRDAAEIRKNYNYVIFCGMGGSGLSVQTVKKTFGEPKGLKIFSLKSTDPAIISDILNEIAEDAGGLAVALEKTLVIPISKSGTTEETVSHKEYFKKLFRKHRIRIRDHIWLVTDPDSVMEKEALKKGYGLRYIQLNKRKDIGGRFTSPTTNIFLLPLAIVAPERVWSILKTAEVMNNIKDINDDLFIRLGAYLYYMATMHGKDKITLMVPESLKELPLWTEQLFEESLGKDGKGVTLFYGEKINPGVIKTKNENDRVFVRINVGQEKTQDGLWTHLVSQKYPVFEINVADINAVGGIMLGFQRAVATIAYLWDICFVDQPAVEGYKNKTREVMAKLQPGESVNVDKTWHSAEFNSLKLYFEPLLATGAITLQELEDEVKKIGADMNNAPAVYAAILTILKRKPGFEAMELMSYGRMTQGLKDIMEGVRFDIFTNFMQMPSKLGEGPDKNHSFHQNIEAGKDMFFSTYLLPLVSQQPDVLAFNENLLKAQAIGTVNSMIEKRRKVVLMTAQGDMQSAESDIQDFFKLVKSYLNMPPVTSVEEPEELEEYYIIEKATGKIIERLSQSRKRVLRREGWSDESIEAGIRDGSLVVMDKISLLKTFERAMAAKIGKKMAELIVQGVKGGKAVVYFEGMDAMIQEPEVVELEGVSDKNNLNNAVLYPEDMLRENGVFCEEQPKVLTESHPETSVKAIYFFGIDQDGNNLTEGDAGMKGLLGGKGANLAQMARLTYELDGRNYPIKVPSGFTITTEEAKKYFENENELKKEVIEEIGDNLLKLEKATGRNFGGKVRPLLLSVRSGARISMPGMMDTILNIGLNDETVEVLAKEFNNPRFAWDSYRRLIMMFADVVLELEKRGFEEIFEQKKKERGVERDIDLDAFDLRDIVSKFKEYIKSKGKVFPQDPKQQLLMAIEAVFKSSNNERAMAYRRINKIPADTLSAANVQSMVFGNLNDNSATGVAFTRDPSTGEKVFYGEFLFNAQGEDVVAGVRTPMPINKDGKEKFLNLRPEYRERQGEIITLEEAMPEVYRQLVAVYHALENFYRDMQDIEFTIQDGNLYLLQTRNGKRTGIAALNILMDLFNGGIINEEEAVMRLSPSQIDEFLHPVFDPNDKQKANEENRIITKGLPASPGAAVGVVVFNSEEAEELSKKGTKVILVREETSAEDINGMYAAQGILTVRGGMTSHAAVVARGMGKTAVVGAGKININEHEGLFTVGGNTVRAGNVISIDGYTGEVILGAVKTMDSIVIRGKKGEQLDDEERKLCERFNKFFTWVDKYRKGVRTNAETHNDVTAAFKYFDADGIGLARTEHMFFKDRQEGENRILKLRKMIVKDEIDPSVLGELSKYQTEDFKDILRIVNGKPVTIRLIDPPLHEFLPDPEKEEGKAAIKELAKELGLKESDIIGIIKSKKEANPMAGFRGDRLLMVYPQIGEMQIRAIFNAYKETRSEGISVSSVEIMIPLVGVVEEFEFFEKMVNKIAEEFGFKRHENYLIGTMIEVPSAVITADEIAKKADFFSFGTNDLTQFTFKFSRDDAGNIVIPVYLKEGVYILKVDPFVTIDEVVGELIRIAVALGRDSNPKLKVGICGEQGGNPESIEETIIPAGLDYASCSPFRVPGAKLASAQKCIRDKRAGKPSVVPYDLNRIKAAPVEILPVSVKTTEETLIRSDRIKLLRKLILAETTKVKKEVTEQIIDSILPDFQKILEKDSKAFFRLFNLSFGELFEGISENEIKGLAEELGVGRDRISEVIKRFHEQNPALGNRGARQILTGYPEIFMLQVKTLCRLIKANKDYEPRAIVPLLIDPQEFKIIRDMADSIMDSEGIDREKINLGACIETPRAALLAGEFANIADFIIFDSIGLTESVLALTKEDAGSFMPAFLEQGIYRDDPLKVISEKNVGRFMSVSAARAREANPEIPIYFFGHKNVSNNGVLERLAEVYKREGVKRDDYYVEPIVGTDRNGRPAGIIKRGDTVISINHRGDRARALTEALINPKFNEHGNRFDPEDLDVTFVPFANYDPETFAEKGIKEAFPFQIPEYVTLSQAINEAGVIEGRFAESDKGSHITYFYDGRKDINHEAKGIHIEIISSEGVPDKNKKAEMKSREIAGAANRFMDSVKDKADKKFLFVNFALDIQGHNLDGDKERGARAVLATDEAVGMIREKVRELGGVLIVTADHGNVEEMALLDAQGIPLRDEYGVIFSKQHTVDNPVPFIIEGLGDIHLKQDGTLANIAPTVLEILGVKKPDGMTESLLEGYQFREIKGPVVVIVRDGWGISKFNNPEADEWNAVKLANPPVDNDLMTNCPWTLLKAHGDAVGLPPYQMGDSDNGHTVIGAGRVIPTLYDDIIRQIESRKFYENPALISAFQKAMKEGHDIHITGLISDGGVHSDYRYVLALLEMAKRLGVEKAGVNIYIHAILDGRDVQTRVPNQSGLHYLRQILNKAKELALNNVYLADASGRHFGMDRDAINRDKKGKYDESRPLWEERFKAAYDAWVYGREQISKSSHSVKEVDAPRFNFEARRSSDSRGKPTVEVDLKIGDLKVTGDAPAGASKGEDEANTVDVDQAIRNINEIIAPMLQQSGLDLRKHEDLIKMEELIIEKAGENFRDLGANATVPVSRALWKMAAKLQGMELYEYIQKYEPEAVSDKTEPVYFCMNIYNGGLHALKKKDGEVLGKDRIDIQEIMIVPVGAKTHREALEMGDRIDRALKDMLLEKYAKEKITRADEAGFSVKGLGDSTEAIGYVFAAIIKAGYVPGQDVKIALDVAATSFYNDGRYLFQGKELTSDEMVDYYLDLVRRYEGKIIFIEDGLAENDWEGWKRLTAEMKKLGIETIGDDIFVTQLHRLNRGIDEGSATSILIKVNQNGTMYGTLKVIKRAKAAGMKWVVSHRSGETLDDSIADLAYATNAFGLKTGDPQPVYDFGDGGEYSARPLVRRVKYIRMADIESAQKVSNPQGSHLVREVKDFPRLSGMSSDELKDKIVFVRVDFNVSLNENGKVGDNLRIVSALPTINYLIGHGAKVVLMSHLGRPDGKVNPEMSLAPVAEELARLLGREVKMAPDCIGDEVDRIIGDLKSGDVVLLENLRFHKEEELDGRKKKGEEKEKDIKLRDEFARRLFKNAEIYINDAFGTMHRAHASMVGAPVNIPRAIGFLVERELKYLDGAKKVLYGLIIGGGPKIDEKVPVVANIIDNIEKGGFIIVGGGALPAFLKLEYGIELGQKVSKKQMNDAKEIKGLAGEKVRLLLPTDFVLCDMDLFAPAIGEPENEGITDVDKMKRWFDLRRIPKGANVYRDVSLDELKTGQVQGVSTGRLFVYDIGAESAKMFQTDILQVQESKSIFWNGTMGVNEIKGEHFAYGSRMMGEALARATEENRVITVIAGGDTAGAAKQFNVADRVTFVSTGGGASVKFLQGKELPGLKSLRITEKKIYTMRLSENGALISKEIPQDRKDEINRYTDMLTSALDILEHIYGLGVYTMVDEVEIVENLGAEGLYPQGRAPLASYRDGVLKIDKLLFDFCPYILFEELEHEFIESITGIIPGSNEIIADVVSTYRNVLRFLNPNLAIIDDRYKRDEKAYQEGILSVLRAPGNPIDPDGEYLALLERLRSIKDVARDEIIASVVRYVMRTKLYEKVRDRLGLPGDIAQKINGLEPRIDDALQVFNEIVKAKQGEELAGKIKETEELAIKVIKTFKGVKVDGLKGLTKKLAGIIAGAVKIASMKNEIAELPPARRGGAGDRYCIVVDKDRIPEEMREEWDEEIKKLEKDGVYRVVYTIDEAIRGYNPENIIHLIDPADLKDKMAEGILYLPMPYLRTSLYMAAHIVIAGGDINKINPLVKKLIFDLYPELMELSSEEQNLLFSKPWSEIILAKIKPVIEEMNNLRKALVEIEKAA